MLDIILTKNIYEANFITHSGTFHADEVYSTVILARVAKKQGKEFKLARTFWIPKNISKETIIYDIGCTQFDHHQAGGNGTRKNGVPYAACGLIWRTFGDILLEGIPNSHIVWKIIDGMLIQGIDAADNGVVPKATYPAKPIDISSITFSFNPTWDSEEDFDEAFLRAIEYADVIFENILKTAISKAKAKSIVEEAIEKSEGKILILERYVPWVDYLLASENSKAKDILFVIFPSLRGGYNWQAVPEGFNTKTPKKETPKEWWGLQATDLRSLTGVATAMFCHNKGFIGATQTLEDAIKIVNIAIEA